MSYDRASYNSLRGDTSRVIARVREILDAGPPLPPSLHATARKVDTFERLADELDTLVDTAARDVAVALADTHLSDEGRAAALRSAIGPRRAEANTKIDELSTLVDELEATLESVRRATRPADLDAATLADVKADVKMVLDAANESEVLGAGNGSDVLGALNELLRDALGSGDTHVAYLLGGSEPRFVELYLRARGLASLSDTWCELRARVQAPYLSPEQALADRLLRAVRAADGLTGAYTTVSYTAKNSFAELAGER